MSVISLDIIEECKPFTNAAAIMGWHDYCHDSRKIYCNNIIEIPDVDVVIFSSVIKLGNEQFDPSQFMNIKPVYIDVMWANRYYTTWLHNITLLQNVKGVKKVFNMHPKYELYQSIVANVDTTIDGIRLAEFDYSNIEQEIERLFVGWQSR